jgi:hypothetical protein
MRLFYGILTVLLLTPAALGRQIHVDNETGNDRAAGEQPKNMADMTGPVKTLARALQMTQPGDVIVLAKTSTPYREIISLTGSRHSGSPQMPFIIRGNGAVLDTSTAIPPEAWKNHEGAVFWFQPRLTTYQQLFLNGRPAVRAPLTADRRLPKLEAHQWAMKDGRIYFCVEKNKLPADYRLSCARDAAGITLYHVAYVHIADLTVQGFQLDGINLANSARHVRISGVTCRNNGRSGISVGGASTVEILRSVLDGNGEAQLLTLPYSKTHLQNVQMPSTNAPGLINRGGEVDVDGKVTVGGPDKPQPAAGQERKP